MNEEKKIGKATRSPEIKTLTNKLNFNKPVIGKKYSIAKEKINMPKNNLRFLNLVRKTSQLANKTIAKIEEKTTAFTTQVEPKSKEKVVTLFVSKSKKPPPSRKNKGFIENLLVGESEKIAREETANIISKANKYSLGIWRSFKYK